MLLSQFAESQSRLGVNLDLYQIHSATQESGVLRKKRVLNHLAKLREDGLAIGLSLSGPNKQQETLGEALQVERDGEKLFDAVQVTWNIFESSIASMAEAAHDAGVIVIVKESLANGRLTNRNKDPGDKMRLKILDEIANTHRTTIDAVAIAAALAQPWANIVLSGAATKGQLLSNLAAKEITLTDEEMGQLGEEAEDPKEYWYARGNLNWN